MGVTILHRTVWCRLGRWIGLGYGCCDNVCPCSESGDCVFHDCLTKVENAETDCDGRAPWDVLS
jgi:hypothetical protein